MIPADRFDPVAHAALAVLPAAEPAGHGDERQQLRRQQPSRRSIATSWSGGSIIISAANDLLTVRYYINNSGTDISGSYGNPVADPLADHHGCARAEPARRPHSHLHAKPQSTNCGSPICAANSSTSVPASATDLAGTIGLTGVTDQAFPAFNIPGYASLSSATREPVPDADPRPAGSRIALLVHAAGTR